VARTFDPNNTNIELSRTLLTIALGEALELEDPAGAVESIFPPGYEDPAIAAAQAAAQMAPPDNGSPHGEFGAAGADDQRHSEENPYGAPMRSQPPGMQESRTLGRGGESQVVWLREQRVQDLPPEQAARLAQRRQQVEAEFDGALTPRNG
jgi:hypothetical protein